MEKIKSAVKAIAGLFVQAASSVKSRFPEAFAKASVLLKRIADACRKRPKVSGSIAVVLCLLVVGNCVSSRSDGDAGGEGLLYEVSRGPLSISVVASGTIENKEKIIVRSELEGAKTTILSLVEEGKQVKQGDLLVELDATEFEDSMLDARIQVQNASSDVVRASETLAITKNKAEADIEKAQLTLKFAELALKKYEEGDYPQSLEKAQSDITIAQEELRRAEDKLAWSKKLFDEEFITRSEYEADELALRKKKIELEMARKRLEVLEKYTHEVDLERLKSDVKQAELAIDRVRRSAKADVLKDEVDLSAKEVSFDRAQDRLGKWKDRIENCRITAPVDGLVVYATSTQRSHWRRRSEPLAAGQTLEGREDLIHLPTTKGMVVKFDVQEASLMKIKKGLPAVITVDALPGRKIMGVVSKVSVLPDTGQSWLNPDLKVYNCEVDITSSTEGLRPGMSCTVEAVFEQMKDAIFVPVQSVVKVDGKSTVFVKSFGGVRRREVGVGLDNTRMIHIRSGLKEGQKVLLSPPLTPAEKKEDPVEVEAVQPATVPRATAPRAGSGGGSHGGGGRPQRSGKTGGGRPQK